MTIWRPMRNICLALPEELILKIDEAAREEWLSRSEYIRGILIKVLSTRESSVLDKIRRIDPLDERFLDLDDS